MDASLAALRADLPSTERVDDLEALVNTKASDVRVDGVEDAVNTKADSATTYTKSQVDEAVGQMSSSVVSLASVVDTKAPASTVSALDTKVNTAVAALDAAKANKADVYTQTQVDAQFAALELDPLTSANTPDCIAAKVRCSVGLSFGRED